MSRAAIRSAVAAWFDPTGIWATTTPAPPDSLDKVWTSFPKRIDFRANRRIDGEPTRCQAVVFIRHSSETRESIGGAHQGWKRRSYDVLLQCFVESYLPDAEDVMDAVDALADALVARAVADHTFGQAPTVIFDAAEPSLDVTFGEPMLNAAAATEQWFQIAFTASSYLQA